MSEDRMKVVEDILKDLGTEVSVGNVKSRECLNRIVYLAKWTEARAFKTYQEKKESENYASLLIPE